jgi:hypothetical protein
MDLRNNERPVGQRKVCDQQNFQNWAERKFLIIHLNLVDKNLVPNVWRAAAQFFPPEQIEAAFFGGKCAAARRVSPTL